MPKKQDEAQTEQIVNILRGHQEGQSLGDRKLDMAALTEITKKVLAYKPAMRTRSKAERDRILKKSGPGIEPLFERQPQEPAPSTPSQEPRRKDFEAPEPSRRETAAPAEPSPGDGPGNGTKRETDQLRVW